jgi:hypothetical protein
MRTTCWPDHQRLQPAHQSVVHFARSSNRAMRSRAFTCGAPLAATRAKQTCNKVGHICKRGRCAHQGSRLQPPSRQARQHTCSNTAPIIGNVRWRCSMCNGQALYPPAGSHATSARWHLLWHSLEGGMWDSIMLLHQMTTGTQDIPKISLTHLRVLPVTLLMLAATRSMLKCSPTTAAPEGRLGLWVTCCRVQQVKLAMPSPAAACLHD